MMNVMNLPKFSGFTVIEKLGVGAGSQIYLVIDKKTGEQRAIKHVIRHDGENARMLEQVEGEYAVAKAIDHPYIRKVFEIRHKKKFFKTQEITMIMEYCPGISLEKSAGRSLVDLLLIHKMVAQGLHGMHEHGYVHCDMKPNNIIIADSGAIRVIDLGQSCKIGTVKQRIQGTPDYIAPEQVKRKPITPTTDVFNLGASIYWALTGKHVPTLIPKKKNDDRIGLAEDVPKGPPPSPHELKPMIPVGLSNLVMECVSRSPLDRPKDMKILMGRIDLLIHMIAGEKLSQKR